MARATANLGAIRLTTMLSSDMTPVPSRFSVFYPSQIPRMLILTAFTVPTGVLILVWVGDLMNGMTASLLLLEEGLQIKSYWQMPMGELHKLLSRARRHDLISFIAMAWPTILFWIMIVQRSGGGKTWVPILAWMLVGGLTKGTLFHTP